VSHDDPSDIIFMNVKKQLC